MLLKCVKGRSARWTYRRPKTTHQRRTNPRLRRRRHRWPPPRHPTRCRRHHRMHPKNPRSHRGADGALPNRWFCRLLPPSESATTRTLPAVRRAPKAGENHARTRTLRIRQKRLRRNQTRRTAAAASTVRTRRRPAAAAAARANPARQTRARARRWTKTTTKTTIEAA